MCPHSTSSSPFSYAYLPPMFLLKTLPACPSLPHEVTFPPFLYPCLPPLFLLKALPVCLSLLHEVTVMVSLSCAGKKINHISIMGYILRSVFTFCHLLSCMYVFVSECVHVLKCREQGVSSQPPSTLCKLVFFVLCSFALFY